MRIGIFSTSFKENEKRIPIHPDSLHMLNNNIKSNLIFEENFFSIFNIQDVVLHNLGFKTMSREELFYNCNILILPKPQVEDFEQMREEQILWGWVHCVQNKEIVDIAIKKRLSFVTWESMYNWLSNGYRDLHIFQKNNELAGYASVLHSLELLGIDGHYGPRRKVSIISYGSCSRGAIYALQGRGFNNIHVYTQRPSHLVANQNPDVYFHNFYCENNEFMINLKNGEKELLRNELIDSDIICNGILQNTNNPFIFLNEQDLYKMKPQSVIIDISCDYRMGFEFATPTTFEQPMLLMPNNIYYYAVDHTPSYLWNAASREISKALIPYLNELYSNSFNFLKNETLKNAIEIWNGKILNENILSFQNRDREFPYQYLY